MCADCAAVVVGQRGMAARLLLVLDHVLGAKELSLVPMILVEPLRRVRQDRLEIVDGAQDDVRDRRRRLRILLDLEPGRLAVQSWKL
jgi:hypothetical protein